MQTDSNLNVRSVHLAIRMMMGVYRVPCEKNMWNARGDLLDIKFPLSRAAMPRERWFAIKKHFRVTDKDLILKRKEEHAEDYHTLDHMKGIRRGSRHPVPVLWRTQRQPFGAANNTPV